MPGLTKTVFSLPRLALKGIATVVFPGFHLAPRKSLPDVLVSGGGHSEWFPARLSVPMVSPLVAIKLDTARLDRTVGRARAHTITLPSSALVKIKETKTRARSGTNTDAIRSGGLATRQKLERMQKEVAALPSLGSTSTSPTAPGLSSSGSSTSSIGSSAGPATPRNGSVIRTTKGAIAYKLKPIVVVVPALRAQFETVDVFAGEGPGFIGHIEVDAVVEPASAAETVPATEKKAAVLVPAPSATPVVTTITTNLAPTDQLQRGGASRGKKRTNVAKVTFPAEEKAKAAAEKAIDDANRAWDMDSTSDTRDELARHEASRAGPVKKTPALPAHRISQRSQLYLPTPMELAYFPSTDLGLRSYAHKELVSRRVMTACIERTISPKEREEEIMAQEEAERVAAFHAKQRREEQAVEKMLVEGMQGRERRMVKAGKGVKLVGKAKEFQEKLRRFGMY